MAWVERRRIQGRKAEYRDIRSKADARGWRVCAHIKTDYNQRPLPWVEVWQEDLGGVRVRTEEHELPMQPDSLEMMIAGPNVHLIVGVHSETVNNQREAVELEMVLPNWYAPWPGQGMAGEPEGAATYIPEEAEVEIDYARIQSMIDQALARFSLGMPAMMRQALLDVVRTEGVLTEAMFAGGSGSHVVYQQLVNTSFTGAKGALDEQPFGDEEEPQP